MQACGFHRSEVPMVNAELPKPSSCFIVPLSMGHSLSSMPSRSALLGKLNKKTQTSNGDGGQRGNLRRRHHNKTGDSTFCSF